MTEILATVNYWVTIVLMVGGLYIVVAHGNMVKKLVGLGIFQRSVYLLFLSPGKVLGGTAPILAEGFELYSNPL
ncbi:MAG: NADH-quinone oxidoreductase subunit K, partial [Alphaproteobacteria bacterium]|nr:NADH-quinone oxidoreductase subunit K [Alphaproteobacteria bacterium]